MYRLVKVTKTASNYVYFQNIIVLKYSMLYLGYIVYMYLFIRFTLYHTEKPILTLVPSGETQQENKNTLLFRLGSEPTIVTYNTKKII